MVASLSMRSNQTSKNTSQDELWDLLGKSPAFTQSIVMGANIQFNSLTLNVAGHDIVTAHDSDV